MKVSQKALLLALLIPFASMGCLGSLESSSQSSQAAVSSPPSQPAKMARLVALLRGKYPNLEARFLQAMCSLQSKYPGLVYSLPRHLLEDLGEEPVQAFRDVAQAENQRYPNIGQQILKLGRKSGPRRAGAEYLAAHYPDLANRFLKEVDNGQFLPARIRQDAEAVISQQFAELPRQVAVAVSDEVQQNFPGLALELIQNRGDEGPLRWLAKNHPDFLRAAAKRVAEHCGADLRKATIATLSALEQDPNAYPAPRVLKAVNFLSANYPTLLAEVLDQRMAARAQLRQQVQSQFPEAESIALTTLIALHPQLLSKAKESIQTHYPDLQADFEQALEGQLPGIVQEVKTFMAQGT